MGDFQVVRSVATLACMTKRPTSSATRRCRRCASSAVDRMTREQLRGSWAGAMGNIHPMPSTFMKWGVDRDRQRQDRPVDQPARRLRLGREFLARHRMETAAAEEVFLPQGFPVDQADTTVR